MLVPRKISNEKNMVVCFSNEKIFLAPQHRTINEKIFKRFEEMK